MAGSFGDIPSPTPTPSPDPNARIRLKARLAGAAVNRLSPKGHARFDSRPNGRRKLKVQVERVNLPAGTVLNVLIDDVKVGEIILDRNMENKLKLDTRRGDTVPIVEVGSTAVVTNAMGATIVSGTFNVRGRVRDDDDDDDDNEIDDDDFFCEQQYRDFLDREGDDSGLAFWQNQIANCGVNLGCRERARINTSGAFVLAIEFQETGALLYRFHKESFGSMPRRNGFLVELQAIAQGVVVGQAGWRERLDANKLAAAERWVSSQAFRDRFFGRSNRQFVDELFDNAGVRFNDAERQSLARGLDQGSETRATVLRKVADNATFVRNESNATFVLMQYFGYLHRNPDEGQDHDLSGFHFWLDKLNQHGGDFHAAEMVKAFLRSAEYRDRFE